MEVYDLENKEVDKYLAGYESGHTRFYIIADYDIGRTIGLLRIQLRDGRNDDEMEY
jgi:hypothetical protein